MKPILLAGHTRPLTKIRYNREGDLLFSVAKDKNPSVWRAEDGERIGTLNGHSGAVWDIAVSSDSSMVITASSDNSCRLWDLRGRQIHVWDAKSGVRGVAFDEGDNRALFITDMTMGQKCTLVILDLAKIKRRIELDQVDTILADVRDDRAEFVLPGSKATCAAWGKLNTHIVTGHEDGSIKYWCPKTGEQLASSHIQTGQIMDIQFGIGREYFIAASKDHSAIMYDSADLKPLRNFNTERPCNAASISPTHPYIIVGGGQDAMNVTTSSARDGKFETCFYHVAFQEEIGRVRGHFGPINTLAFHPSGRGFASGSEDGFVRLHFFDDDYFEFNHSV